MLLCKRAWAGSPGGAIPESQQLLGFAARLAAGGCRRAFFEPCPSQSSSRGNRSSSDPPEWPRGMWDNPSASLSSRMLSPGSGREQMCAVTTCPQCLAQCRTHMTTQKMWTGCELMASLPHH